jgi:hypothetical protein
MAHRVGHDHALHGVDGGTFVEVPELQTGHQRERCLGQEIGGLALRVGHPQVHHGDEQGGAQQHDLRANGEPIHGVHIGGPVQFSLINSTSK